MPTKAVGFTLLGKSHLDVDDDEDTWEVDEWELEETEAPSYGLNQSEQVPSEFKGRVQALVQMFDKFARNFAEKGTAKLERTCKNDSAGAGPSNTSTASSPAEQPEVGETCCNSVEMESRVESLEIKMSAIARYTSDRISHEIEALGESYLRQVDTEKNISSLKTTTKVLDSELDEISGSLDNLEMLLKKENKLLKAKVAKLEKLAVLECNTTQQRLKALEMNMHILTDLAQNCTDQLTNVLDALGEIIKNKPQSPEADRK